MKYLTLLVITLLLTSCPPPEIILNLSQNQNLNLDLPKIEVRTYNVTEIEQLIENSSKILVELEKEKQIIQKELESFHMNPANSSKKEIASLEARDEYVESKLTEHNRFIENLRGRKNILQSTSGDDFNFLDELTVDKFGTLIGLKCGDEISAAYKILVNTTATKIEEDYSETTVAFSYMGKNIVIVEYSNSSNRIQSVRVLLTESLQYFNSQSNPDKKYKIIGLKMSRVIEALGRHPDKVISNGYSLYYSRGNNYNWVGFKNVSEDYFNISEIKVSWSYSTCSGWNDN